jgi:hypothetical protein
MKLKFGRDGNLTRPFLAYRLGMFFGIGDGFEGAGVLGGGAIKSSGHLLDCYRCVAACCGSVLLFSD